MPIELIDSPIRAATQRSERISPLTRPYATPGTRNSTRMIGMSASLHAGTIVVVPCRMTWPASGPSGMSIIAANAPAATVKPTTAAQSPRRSAAVSVGAPRSTPPCAICASTSARAKRGSTTRAVTSQPSPVSRKVEKNMNA